MGATLKLLLLSVVLNVALGFTALYQRSEVNLARTHAEVALDANYALERALEAKDKVCKIADVKTTEYQQERETFANGTDEILNKLDEIKASQQNDEVNKDAPYITKGDGSISLPLDAQLPTDVIGLLEDACNRVSGSSCANAR